jgi:hypothetical protein
MRVYVCVCVCVCLCSYFSPSHTQVGSHGYGSSSPAKGTKVEYQPEPLWVPPAKSVGFPAPPPVPRSSLNDSVASHYGADYQPHNPYNSSFDESQADEAQTERRSSVTKTTRTITKKVVTEEYEEGQEPEDAAAEEY